MNPLLLKHPRNIREGGTTLVLVITFLALPYLIDVVYYGDFNPTHFAQENVIDESLEALDGKGLSLIADDQDDAVVIKTCSPPQRFADTQDRVSAGDVSPPHYLISASLISRPPPAS